jgi:hypothetical protein
MIEGRRRPRDRRRRVTCRGRGRRGAPRAVALQFAGPLSPRGLIDRVALPSAATGKYCATLLEHRALARRRVPRRARCPPYARADGSASAATPSRRRTPSS